MNTEAKILAAYTGFEADCANFSVREKEVTRQSFEIAKQSLADIYRENDDPFIFHAINIAKIIVSEIGLGYASAAAIFFHEALRYKEQNVSNIQKQYGKEIAEIVSRLTKISAIDIKATSLQAENFRKLIVSLSNDPRVTIIKLADRLEVMRSLAFFSPLKQQKKATETLLLYAPIAHQLGLYHLKSELEDLSLRYTNPEGYRFITNKLKSTANDRNKLIKEFLKPIEAELKKREFKYHVKSRTKSVYSIWTKMQKQQVDFEGVYDVFAIRIILDTTLDKEKDTCWEVFSIITSFYKQNTERTRDWISVPKASGYESLHTTVDTSDGKTVEVQIRTERMDEIAEKGVAAHWRYKGVQQQAQGIQQWLDNVRELLESPAKKNEDNFLNFTQNEIFVFTPNGDLRKLPSGATVLDFAFDIHSGIGARCVGAKVNGKNVSIKEVLKTGDSVEVATSKNQQPKSDWLSYVVTSKARTRIKAALREEEVKVANIGKELLERRLKNWKLVSLDEALAVLMKHYKLKTITEFYSQLATEEINLQEIKDILTKAFSDEAHDTETKQEEAAGKKIKFSEEKDKSEYLVIDDNLRNLNYKLAKCCSPIRGDDIFGFVTINDGIKIHRFTCPNATRLFEKYDYRVLKAKWRETPNDTFQANLKVMGDDELGLVRNITDALISLGVALRNLNVSNAKGMCEVRLQIMVTGTKQLDTLIYKLQNIKGASKVVRLSQ